MFQRRLFDGGEELSFENREENSIPKQNVLIPVRYIKYIFMLRITNMETMRILS